MRQTRSLGSILLAGVAALLCVATAASLSGCNIFAFAAYAAGGLDKVEKQFQLEDKPTLIWVDDPQNLLGSPTLSAVVVANIEFYLKKQDAFGVQEKAKKSDGWFADSKTQKPVEEPLLPQAALYEVQSRLGADFEKASIGEIGKLAGAQQVVHVLVTDVVYQASPGYWRPRAVCEVKVLDVIEGKRLFPPQQAFESGVEGGGPLPGYRVKTELHASTGDMGTDQADMLLLQQKLARNIGLDVSRLFYDWAPDEPGTRFEDK